MFSTSPRTYLTAGSCGSVVFTANLRKPQQVISTTVFNRSGYRLSRLLPSSDNQSDEKQFADCTEVDHGSSPHSIFQQTLRPIGTMRSANEQSIKTHTFPPSATAPVKALRRPDGTTKASPGFQGPTYPRHNARESRCSASRVRPIRHAICWGLGKRRLSVKERRRLPVEGRLASQVRVSKDDCSFAPERLRDGPGNFDPVAPSSVAIEGRVLNGSPH
jgi:hypothetical protein